MDRMREPGEVLEVLSLQELPANFPDLALQIAAALVPVYGEDGAVIYRTHAPVIFGDYLRLPHHAFWAVLSGAQCLALILCRVVHGRGEIALAHRVCPETPPPMERLLLSNAVAYLQSEGAESILAEFLPTSPFVPPSDFEALGFLRVPRLLLRAQLDRVVPAIHTVRALAPSDAHGIGECLAAAYVDDDGRILHREVQTPEEGSRFASRVLHGELGATAPGSNVGIMRNGRWQAVALGCILAPGIGFTLQIATLPEARGQGMARALLHAQHQGFRQAGCQAASLAVSRGNTVARALYESMAYQELTAFNSYIWQGNA